MVKAPVAYGYQAFVSHSDLPQSFSDNVIADRSYRQVMEPQHELLTAYGRILKPMPAHAVRGAGAAAERVFTAWALEQSQGRFVTLSAEWLHETLYVRDTQHGSYTCDEVTAAALNKLTVA